MRLFCRILRRNKNKEPTAVGSLFLYFRLLVDLEEAVFYFVDAGLDLCGADIIGCRVSVELGGEGIELSFKLFLLLL